MPNSLRQVLSISFFNSTLHPASQQILIEPDPADAKRWARLGDYEP